MKFTIKKLIVLILLSSVLISCSKENDPKINEAQNAVKTYLESNYKDIESVHFTKAEDNPLGDLMVSGYLNGDEDKFFSFHYDFDRKEVTVGGANAVEKMNIDD
ncbi:DUF1433 domain-containing protein [Metabacillus indicus]|uniref:DUF1433 domain-containing protein n=1 Tax=Metabacillus indicus TaxID=246786 RepID=UPI003CF57A0F